MASNYPKDGGKRNSGRHQYSENEEDYDEDSFDDFDSDDEESTEELNICPRKPKYSELAASAYCATSLKAKLQQRAMGKEDPSCMGTIQVWDFMCPGQRFSYPNSSGSSSRASGKAGSGIGEQNTQGKYNLTFAIPKLPQDDNQSCLDPNTGKLTDAPRNPLGKKRSFSVYNITGGNPHQHKSSSRFQKINFSRFGGKSQFPKLGSPLPTLKEAKTKLYVSTTSLVEGVRERFRRLKASEPSEIVQEPRKTLTKADISSPTFVSSTSTQCRLRSKTPTPTGSQTSLHSAHSVSSRRSSRSISKPSILGARPKITSTAMVPGSLHHGEHHSGHLKRSSSRERNQTVRPQLPGGQKGPSVKEIIQIFSVQKKPLDPKMIKRLGKQAVALPGLSPPIQPSKPTQPPQTYSQVVKKSARPGTGKHTGPKKH